MAVRFEEVSGLNAEMKPIEYRSGNGPGFSTIKMPGLKKYGNATLKKGVYLNDQTFWGWYNEIKMNTISRVPITISLLDEGGSATMVWKLSNAWPTKITGTDLKADGNEVAIETLELAYESIEIMMP
jgi:phage tail-like protein